MPSTLAEWRYEGGEFAAVVFQRWSRKMTIDDCIAEMEKEIAKGGKEGGKPVFVKVPAGCSKAQRCATLQDAIAYLTAHVHKVESQKEYLGHPNRGISVQYLGTTLLNEMQAVGLSKDDAKVFEIEPQVIRAKGETVVCPRDHKKGAAYVDCLHGRDNAWLASYMLSYTWGYKVIDIVQTLKSFCIRHGLDMRREYIWICCLCINQHRVQERTALGQTVPFEEFREAFGRQATGIGHIIAMMSPWHSPGYLQRVWCDFEMYTAITKNVEVTIEMPPHDAVALEQALSEKADKLCPLWKALAGVQVENAQASVETDKECILSLIKEGPGFRAMNTAVADKLRGWIMQVLIAAWESHKRNGTLETPEGATLVKNIGVAKGKCGDLDGQMEAYEEARRIHEATGMLESSTGADLVVNIGTAKGKRGDLDGTMQAYEQARKILEAAGALETQSGAAVLTNIGRAKGQRGDLDGKMEAYEQARRICEATGTLETPEGADLVMNIGRAKGQRGDLDGQMEAYEQASRILEATGTLDTPDGATLVMHIGKAKGQRGDLGGELEAYEQARRIREATGTLETSEGAALLANIGKAKARRGDRNGQMEAFEQARRIREATGTLETPEGAKVVMYIGTAKGQRRDLDGQMEAYEQARRIREATGTLETPDGATLVMNIGRAKGKRGDLEGEMEAYEQAERIRKATGTLETAEGIRLVQNITGAKGRCYIKDKVAENLF